MNSMKKILIALSYAHHDRLIIRSLKDCFVHHLFQERRIVVDGGLSLRAKYYPSVSYLKANVSGVVRLKLSSVTSA